MPASNYVGRYPPPWLVAKLVKVPYLYNAPDIPRGHPAYQSIRDFQNGRLTCTGPYSMEPDCSPGAAKAAVFGSGLAKMLGIKSKWVATSGETCTIYRPQQVTEVRMGRGDLLAVLHELSHAAFGPSEATACAWSRRNHP